MSNYNIPTNVPAETTALFEEKIKDYFLAWQNKELEAGLSFFAEEGRFDDYHVGVQAKDKDGVRQWLETAFATLNDIKFEMVSIAGDRNHFIAECLMSWTWAVDYESFKKGEPHTMKGVSSLDFNDDGKIVWQRDYYIDLKPHFMS